MLFKATACIINTIELLLIVIIVGNFVVLSQVTATSKLVQEIFLVNTRGSLNPI